MSREAKARRDIRKSRRKKKKQQNENNGNDSSQLSLFFFFFLPLSFEMYAHSTHDLSWWGAILRERWSNLVKKSLSSFCHFATSASLGAADGPLRRRDTEQLWLLMSNTKTLSSESPPSVPLVQTDGEREQCTGAMNGFDGIRQAEPLVDRGGVARRWSIAAHPAALRTSDSSSSRERFKTAVCEVL